MTQAEAWAALINVVGPAITAIIVVAIPACLFVFAVTRKRLKGGYTFVTALACLGVTTGFAAGHSREAVVGVVLPAVLTFVSAQLGYMLTKEGLADWKPVIPVGIIVMTIGSLVGLSLGSTVRGRFDAYTREYSKALLRYQHVELEYEKAKHLAELEVWKAKQLVNLKAPGPEMKAP